MLDACNDARNKAEVSPQIYNAMMRHEALDIWCIVDFLHQELSTIPLSH